MTEEISRVFICILGGDNESRTRLTQRFITGEYDEKINSTKQEINSKHYDFNNQTIKIDIIDKSSQDSLAEMRHRYYQEVDGFVFVIDINNPASIEEFKILYKDAADARNEKKGMLCGVIAAYIDNNAKDNTPAISSEKLQAIGKEYKLKVFETSVETGKNVQELFDEAVRKILFHKNQNPPKEEETTGACCLIY